MDEQGHRSDDQPLYPTHTQNLIMNWAAEMCFPPEVLSTAQQINSRLRSYFDSSPYVCTLKYFEACCFKAQTCLFLACKFEDIHGHLTEIMTRIEDFTELRYLAKIQELEVEIFEFLGFNFNFVNLYFSALAVKLLIEQRLNIPVQWDSVSKSLGQAICIADLNRNLMEVVLSSFDEELIVSLPLKYSLDVVQGIKSQVQNFKLLSDWDVRSACSRMV